MASEQDDAQPTATTTSGKSDGALMTVLRWVHPGGVPVSVLADSLLTIGRDASCQIRLDTQRVSRRHAEVKQVGGRYVIRDLESKNGVYVNGRRVTDTAIETGDVLRIGNFVAVVERVDASGLPGFRDLGYGIHGGPAVHRALARARAFSDRHESVLLQGESGIGKELFARALHRSSGRQGPFLVVRCAAVERDELQADLAAAGTLFFDELSRLPLELQAELASSAERGPVATRGKAGVDERFVFATEAPLAQLPPRRLHPELRAHLEERVVALPPLRTRRADIAPLFLEFLGAHADPPKLDHELIEHLCLGAWPLNLRELENVAKRLLALYPDQPELRLVELAETLGAPLTPETPPGGLPSAHSRRAAAYPPEQVAALKEAIERHGGNLTKAANELGITRPKAYRMLGMVQDD